jgi:urea transport system substrate-binding protein
MTKELRFLNWFTVTWCQVRSYGLSRAGWLVLCLVLVVPAVYAGEDTIKIGILHSCPAMATSERVLMTRFHADGSSKQERRLFDGTEPIIADPASDWDVCGKSLGVTHERSRSFALTSASCNWSADPRAPNGLLFYPVQQRAKKAAQHFHTGAAPNQQAIPAVRYLMSKEGRRGSQMDSASALTTSSAHDQPDLERTIAEVSPDDTRRFTRRSAIPTGGDRRADQGLGSREKDSGASTVNGDANTYLYKEL